MIKYYPYLITVCHKDFLLMDRLLACEGGKTNQCPIKASSVEEAATLINPYVAKDYEIVSIERYKLQMIEV